MSFVVLVAILLQCLGRSRLHTAEVACVFVVGRYGGSMTLAVRSHCAYCSKEGSFDLQGL